MNILIMGPAGSGKGTQSELIKKNFEIMHISTGDLLRSEVKNSTVLGLEAKKYMDAGKLVPDEVVIGMVENCIASDKCANGYLLDGFPRTLAQAEALNEITEKHNKPVELVINLEVDFEALKERITGRRLCKHCGAIYHIATKPSKTEGICDICGGNLYQRSDDTEEQLKIRLQEHEKNTKPALDFYRKKGIVLDVAASRLVDEVFGDIKQALGKI